MSKITQKILKNFFYNLFLGVIFCASARSNLFVCANSHFKPSVNRKLNVRCLAVQESSDFFNLFLFQPILYQLFTNSSLTKTALSFFSCIFRRRQPKQAIFFQRRPYFFKRKYSIIITDSLISRISFAPKNRQMQFRLFFRFFKNNITTLNIINTL